LILKREIDSVVLQGDIVDHSDRIREPGVRLPADDEPSYALARLTKFVRNPPHVAKHLTDDLVGFTALLEFNDDKSVGCLLLGKNVDDACVSSELLPKKALSGIGIQSELTLEDGIKIRNDEVFEVLLQDEFSAVLHPFL